MTSPGDTSPTAELTPLFATITENALTGDPVRVVMPDGRAGEYVAGETLEAGADVSVDARTGRLVRRHLHFAGPDAPDDGPARMEWARREAARRHAEDADRRAELLDDLDRAPAPTTANPASIAAAAKVAGHVGSQRRLVLDAFTLAGPHGLTDDELAVETGLVPNRVATRRKELQEAGLVETARGMRATRAGIDATIHRITALGELAARRPDQETANP